MISKTFIGLLCGCCLLVCVGAAIIIRSWYIKWNSENETEGKEDGDA